MSLPFCKMVKSIRRLRSIQCDCEARARSTLSGGAVLHTIAVLPSRIEAIATKESKATVDISMGDDPGEAQHRHWNLVIEQTEQAASSTNGPDAFTEWCVMPESNVTCEGMSFPFCRRVGSVSQRSSPERALLWKT